MLSNRGPQPASGAEGDRDYSVRLVLPHRMVIVVLQTYYRGLGGPGERRQYLQAGRRGLLFPSPGSPGVLRSHVCSSPRSEPEPQIQEKRRRPPPTGTEPGGGEEHLGGRGRVRSWGRPRAGGLTHHCW